jgi:hypothetical protein
MQLVQFLLNTTELLKSPDRTAFRDLTTLVSAGILKKEGDKKAAGIFLKNNIGG